MNQYIEHKGVVKEVREHSLLVEISQQSSCSTCSSKSSCFSSGKNQLTVEVNCSGRDYKVGDVVELRASGKIGFIAVFYAYFLPLVLLVAVLFGTVKLFDVGDVMAILLSFVALAVYYFILYLFRDKLKNKINFELK